MKNLYLCGVGNSEGIRLALRVNQVQSRWDRILLLDDDPSKHGARKLGLEVVGSFDLLAQADPTTDEVVNLVTRTTEGRAKARERIARFGVPFTSLIYPDVDLLGADLDEEVTIYSLASIGAEAHVGRSSVVLIGALVGHGVRLGEGCVIAPHAVINARVALGDRVYVGSNASILPDLSIGEGATIAANSVVFSDVPAGATAIGVPATIMPSLTSRMPAGSIDIEAGRAKLGIESAICNTDLEQGVVRILQNLLGIETVPPQTANFFDLGGTSLKALQFCQQLRDQLGIQIQLLDVYHYPTLQALVRYLGGGSSETDPMSQARQRAALRRQRFHL